MIFSENRFTLFRIMLQHHKFCRMPVTAASAVNRPSSIKKRQLKAAASFEDA